MIPVSLLNPGENGVIKKIGGRPEVKKHLENLGFSAGADIAVINSLGGNIIVKVRETRVAISNEMAQKIFI